MSDPHGAEPAPTSATADLPAGFSNHGHPSRRATSASTRVFDALWRGLQGRGWSVKAPVPQLRATRDNGRAQSFRPWSDEVGRVSGAACSPEGSLLPGEIVFFRERTIFA